MSNGELAALLFGALLAALNAAGLFVLNWIRAELVTQRKRIHDLADAMTGYAADVARLQGLMSRSGRVDPPHFGPRAR